MSTKVQKIMTQPIVRAVPPPAAAHAAAASTRGAQTDASCMTLRFPVLLGGACARVCCASRARRRRAEPHLPLLTKRASAALATATQRRMPHARHAVRRRPRSPRVLTAVSSERPPAGAPLCSLRAQKTRIQLWLYENTDLRVEGKIIVRRRTLCPLAPPPRSAGHPAARPRSPRAHARRAHGRARRAHAHCALVAARRS